MPKNFPPLAKNKDFPMMKVPPKSDNPFGPPPEIFERMKIIHGGSSYAPKLSK